MERLKFQSKPLASFVEGAALETEIESLEGVLNVKIDWQTGHYEIDIDASKITKERIVSVIENSKKSAPQDKKEQESTLRESVYYIKGMHCASCEIIIEKRLLKIKGVKSVDASTGKGEVVIEYEGNRPSAEYLDKVFKEEGYSFFEQPIRPDENNEKGGFFNALVIAAVVIIGFLWLNKSGLSSFVSVNARSSLPAFFIFGILAGLSSCAALVGGIVLSMSKQWLAMYSSKDSTWQKLQPHLLFNTGRLISYGLFGAILGGIGSKLQISFSFSSTLIIVVSILMFFLALQMLGVKSLAKFQLTAPKFIIRRAADESKLKGRFMPFVMGALTFFLPCGFTLTAQGLSLLSGNAAQGGLIMLAFALGTAPVLLAIGLSSVKFSVKPHLSSQFLKVAGILVLFFALFNINAQLNVLGLPSFSDALAKSNTAVAVKANQQVNNNPIDERDLPPIVDGKQIMKMDAASYGYTPNYFKVRAGTPVRWEITDTGTSGCTNAVLARGLFDGQIDLNPGQTSFKEFTPTQAGKYKFSCWMGMISGTIEVVDVNNPAKPSAVNNNNVDTAAAIVPSGAKGCGCGGGGSGSCAATAR